MKPLTKATSKLLAPIAVLSRDRMKLTLDREAENFVIELYQPSTLNGHSTWPSQAVSAHFMGRFPERRQLDGLCTYSVPCTDYSATIIHYVFPRDQIESTNDAQVMLDYLIASGRQQDLNAETIARWRDQSVMAKNILDVGGDAKDVKERLALEAKPVPVEYDVSKEYPLAHYQKVALHCASQSDGYALFMEQGTGKTPIVIARVCNAAKKLWEGGLDDKSYKLKVAQVLAQTEAKIRDQTAELEQNGKAQLKRKREKLRNAAKKRAERIQCGVNYTGSAAGLLKETQKVIRKAEGWLTQRYIEISREMQHLTQAYEDTLAARKQRIKDDLNATCQRTIDRLRGLCQTTGEKRMYRTIIVCPKNVRLNWYNEFAKFSTEPGKVAVLRGGRMQRAKQLIEALAPGEETQYTVIVCSYETLQNTWEFLKTIQWDLAVLDESHYAKSPQAKRARCALELRDVSDKRMVLTGTPITNHVLDLYMQWEFLGKGASGFSSWKVFRSFYGVFKATGDSKADLVGFQNLPFIKERLARSAFIIYKSEALPNLPSKVYDVCEAEMTPEQTDLYNRVCHELAVEIENDLDAAENKQLVIQNSLTKMLRLAHITSGFIKWDAKYGDDGEVLIPSMTDQFDPNPKIEALVELLKEKSPNDKTLVWACWVQDIKSVAARLKVEGIEAVTYYGQTKDKARDEAEYRFNCDPDCKVMISNPAAGGVGLNLLGYDHGNLTDDPRAKKTNANHEIYFSQNWSPTTRWQSEDRCHRRGTRELVRVTDLCVPQTIDEEIRARVTAKRATALEVADVRSILSSLLKGLQ